MPLDTHACFYQGSGSNYPIQKRSSKENAACINQSRAACCVTFFVRSLDGGRDMFDLYVFEPVTGPVLQNSLIVSLGEIYWSEYLCPLNCD